MKTAYVFPGQGAQYVGMGARMYARHARVRALFDEADEVLGFRLTETMFAGSAEALRATHITQLAVFVHSIATIRGMDMPIPIPAGVAGHSLGEFSALVVAGALDFPTALRLVALRAQAMQAACQALPSTMAVVLGLADQVVEDMCAQVVGEVVVPANYNAPGQLVISGSCAGIAAATERLQAAGARRILALPVGGAFHSPLMAPAARRVRQAIQGTAFKAPSCPIYQNVHGQATQAVDAIRENLCEQLTAPVRWKEAIENMCADGYTHFVECGPGKVLQGLIKKIAPHADTAGIAIDETECE